jgi:2-oxo-4-hydroxy-4-carboxy--5-ureidoimidazoline (OHCU) decarboxylase
MEAAKTYWLRYFPLEEMPDLASIIAEGYRKNLITDDQALSGMKMVEKSIEDWVKQNNKLNKQYTKKFNIK